MKEFQFIKLLLIFTLLFIHQDGAYSQNINYFGVAFSPYVKPNKPWNSYTVDDIKKMLNIMLPKHNSISTYSMGIDDGNANRPWDQVNANCLIARSAAQINRERNSVVLSVSQGVHQNPNPNTQRVEIDNAFKAVEDANRIFPGTVWGIVFTNEHVVDANKGRDVLNMIKNNKERARRLGVKVGTRVHTCQEIWNGNNQNILIEIGKVSDFIMCNFYPANPANADVAIGSLTDSFYGARDGFHKKSNPNLEVILGETGWATEGKTGFNHAHNNNVQKMTEFWNKMKDWANQRKIKVQMFEGFDEPWKGGEPGEKHLGWWKWDQGRNAYVEKATGRVV